MTRDDALEIIDRMPYIRTIQAPNNAVKVRKEFYSAALNSDNPLELVSLIKTVYLRKKDRALFEGELDYFEKAESKLYPMLAEALEISREEVLDYIKEYIKNA